MRHPWIVANLCQKACLYRIRVALAVKPHTTHPLYIDRIGIQRHFLISHHILNTLKARQWCHIGFQLPWGLAWAYYRGQCELVTFIWFLAYGYLLTICLDYQSRFALIKNCIVFKVTAQMYPWIPPFETYPVRLPGLSNGAIMRVPGLFKASITLDCALDSFILLMGQCVGCNPGKCQDLM